MINLNMWDTPGQEDFDKMRASTYNDTDAVIVCFGIGDHSAMLQEQAGAGWCSCVYKSNKN